MASISLQGITKRFGGVTAVDDMRLDIADGEFFVLLGPSGAGKTTTLRLIAGLETPDSGCVRMNGAGIRRVEPGDQPQRRRLAGPARAQQHKELAVGDVEPQVVDRGDIAETLGEASKRNASHGACSVGGRWW
jgi:ABC-type multidrug transport system ATPase subunit